MRRNPAKIFWALFASTALLSAGCGGDAPTTLPPDTTKPDAGTIWLDDAGQQQEQDGGAGKDAGTDAGGPNKQTRSLNAVGDPTPEVVFGQKIRLQAILLGTEIGVIPNETVTFTIVAGEGTLSEATAVTDATGIARVEFTAGTTQGTAHVIALASGVADEDRADWVINVRQPSRELAINGVSYIRLGDSQTTTAAVKVTQRGQPVGGAKVTFEVSGPGVKLDGQNVTSKLATTSIQGIARVDVTGTRVSQTSFVQLRARTDYANSVAFTIELLPAGQCTDDSECRPGEICDIDNEACVERPGCLDDTECAPGHVCTPDGECVATTTTGCQTTDDCASTPGTYCNLDLEICVIGCETDEQCTAPEVCDQDRHRCVAPGDEPCFLDEDCGEGMLCIDDRCIPDSTVGDNCTDSYQCPPGQYCASSGNCVPGCDSDELCDSGLCNLQTHTCINPECWEDVDCNPEGNEGMVCDENYQCVQGPPVILDVSGDWENVVQIFHVGNMLPPSIANVFNKVDQAFQIANALISGDVGDLLDDWGIPGFIADAIGSAVAGAIDDYLPDWVSEVVHIGSDVIEIIKNFEVRSTMNIRQPAQGSTDRQAVSGVDTWQRAIFYWYTNDCPPPPQGQAPDPCSYIEIDLASAAFRPHATPFTGRVNEITLSIDTHNISFQYGVAARMVLELLLEYFTGYSTIEEALAEMIDCVAINDWIKDFAHGIVGDLFYDEIESINLVSQCNSFIRQGAAAAINAIEGLSFEAPISMSGRATITREPGNYSPQADHLTNGIWNGSFNNNAPSQGTLADWYADRY
ncbi:MAG: DUF7107 domain-containing protein [Myxococcales bacterium]|jgi:hypothetical protein